MTTNKQTTTPPTAPTPSGDTPPPKDPPKAKADSDVRLVMTTTVEIGESKLIRGQRFKAEEHKLSASDIKMLKDKGYMVEVED